MTRESATTQLHRRNLAGRHSGRRICKLVILASHPEEQMRALAWYGLVAVAVYLLLASLALRWRHRRGVRVAQYDPPPGISPAAAAYLWERGVSDKPFVVAMVSMAAKGFLKIEQGPTDYLLSRVDASVPLEDEEQVVAESIFRGGNSSVCLSQLFALGRAAREARNSLEAAVEPQLLSAHFAWFVPGLTLTFWCFLAALYADLDGIWKSQVGGIVILPPLAAVWAMLATIKTLPATLYKLKSHMPGRTPRPIPLAKRDGMVFILLAVTLASLAVFAWLSSAQLALQFGGFLLVNLLGSVALRSPTSAGHRLLEQLSDFRMFLAEVDSDRVNRMNAPTASSPASEKYWAWALALDVEHAWGEQFTAAILNLLGPESATAGMNAVAPEGGRRAAEIMDLHLR
jgi:hypothetical protein